jgi:hypothetical protein
VASDQEATRYEIRGNRLFVNGERQTVMAETIAAAAALYRVESRDPIDPAPAESAMIPEDLARLIRRLEARKALRGLRDELAGADSHDRLS